MQLQQRNQNIINNNPKIWQMVSSADEEIEALGVAVMFQQNVSKWNSIYPFFFEENKPNLAGFECKVYHREGINYAVIIRRAALRCVKLSELNTYGYMGKDYTKKIYL